jgi:cyclopropane-fatty-acyl-phospholipid synthase
MILNKLLKRIPEKFLPHFHCGRLKIVLPSQEFIERQGDKPGPQAILKVHRWRALWRMALDGEHGFADGYLAGDWSTPDLKSLLEFCLRNEETVMKPASGSWLTRFRNRLFHRSCENTKRGSRRNIAAHYDLGNEFYREWLDRDMNYSSAMYAGGETLEAAQKNKLDRAVELLDLKGGEKVLEIGCGWGALAERVVRRGCNIVGLTLSKEQLAYATARLAHGVGNGNADLRLQDYRDVAGRYDRIASIEMLEAVGEKYWKTYFAKLKECLREGGSAVLQVITIDESRYDNYRSHPDFIQRYIFPGGMLPTPSIVAREAKNAGLKLVHQESFGESYAKTLREWQNRFLHAWPKIEMLGFDQRFRRMWEFYLTYCEIGFAFGAVDVKFFKLVRP